METKAITPSFTERGTIVCPAATVNSKLHAIENLFESCDNKLAGAEMSGCGYDSQSGEINSMAENMRNLNLYAATAHERVSDYLDRPLYEHFKKNATETITAINLSEITTDNTFGLAEYVEIRRQGQYFVNKSVKNNLTMKDFLGLQEITAEDGMPILENAETMWEFASLFRLEYDTMTEKTVDLDSYLNWYLDTGDAEHKGYHPVADMISGILDITIFKPMLECELGKDFITGEYLTEYDIRWKSAGIIIDLVTLGRGSQILDEVKTLKDFLEASGKTLTVDALAATATYGTAYVGEELELSEEAILVLSTLAGVGTSYAAGKAIFKDAKVVVESGTDALNKLKPQNFMDELAGSGVKYNPDEVIAVTKTADGKLVWLENGTDTAGLNHIIAEHADDFLNKGITQKQIPDYVMNALENGKIVGYQGRGTGRPIYEFTYNGEIQKVAISVGNNGFVVGANPK